MAKVTISQAAKLAGLSRSRFYAGFIDKGLITVEQDSNGKPKIDTSELLRVFGELRGETIKNTGEDSLKTDTTAILQERIKGLESLLEARENELNRCYEREQRLSYLLEDKSKKDKISWWPWSSKKRD